MSEKEPYKIDLGVILSKTDFDKLEDKKILLEIRKHIQYIVVKIFTESFKIHLKDLIQKLKWKANYKRIQKRINWLFKHLGGFETMILATKDSPLTYDKDSHGEWDIRMEREKLWEDK